MTISSLEVLAPAGMKVWFFELLVRELGPALPSARQPTGALVNSKPLRLVSIPAWSEVLSIT